MWITAGCQFAHAGGEDFIDAFTYTVSDGSLVSAPQTFVINTTPQNDTPTAAVAGTKIFRPKAAPSPLIPPLSP